MSRTHPIAVHAGRACLLLLALALPAAAARAAELPYAESFDGADGAPWPAPWSSGTSHVTIADLAGGRARLNGDAGFVARMLLPGYSETGIEALVTFEFENVGLQGIGFYARQNGGTLQEYLPHGRGYAMFLKGSWAWPEDLGLWREIDGVETQFAWGFDPVPGGLQDLVRYRLRYRVTQEDGATTRLQARVWPEAQAEPAAWTIDATDTHPELQGTAGSFAIDLYNHAGASHVFLDDLVIQRFPGVAAAPSPRPAPSRGLALSAPRPNPSRGGAAFELFLPVGGDVEVEMHDVAGRLVARPFSGRLAAGAHALRIGEPTSALAPGVYVLSARAGAERARRRVVVMP